MKFPIRLFLATILVCLASFAIHPALAQENGTKADTATITTGEGKPEDREIDLRIEEIFDEIDGLENVNSSVRSGVVTLRGTVSEASVAERAVELANRVEGVVAVENEITEVTEVSERLVPVLGRFEKRLQTAYDYLPLAGFAGLVWLFTAGFGWFISSRRRPWSWIAPNTFIADLLRQIVFLGFLLLGLVLALDIMDATAVLSTILGAAGIVGLAIGFAVRDTVENYIASILLSIRQPFRPKDFIEIDGYSGHVIRLTSRATILMDMDGNHIRIPNASVYKHNIVNYSRNPERRFSFKLGIDADSELHVALDLCRGALEQLDFVLDEPAPAVWIDEVGDSNVVLEAAGWINQTRTDFLKARSEAVRLTKLALESNGIALPEPIYRLKFDGAEKVSEGVSGETADKAGKTYSPKDGKQAASAESMVATDTTADQTVLKKVEEERQHADTDGDLLNEEARDELGPRPDETA